MVVYSDLIVELRSMLRQVDKQQTLSLDIRRDFIIEDAMREAKKKKFDPHKNVKVIIYFLLIQSMILCVGCLHK